MRSSGLTSMEVASQSFRTFRPGRESLEDYTSRICRKAPALQELGVPFEPEELEVIIARAIQEQSLYGTGLTLT